MAFVLAGLLIRLTWLLERIILIQVFKVSVRHPYLSCKLSGLYYLRHLVRLSRVFKEPC